jgi:hypothetical protein
MGKYPNISARDARQDELCMTALSECFSRSPGCADTLHRLAPIFDLGGTRSAVGGMGAVGRFAEQ